MEKEYFTRGDHLFVFNIGQFKLAPIICYDIRIPELSRTLVVDHGVDVILHCGAYYRDESFVTWHAFVTTRSIENQAYCLSLNRAGQHFGDSLFCLPWMDDNKPPVKLDASKEQFLCVEVKRDVIKQERESYSFLSDRLPSYSIPVMSA
jgi:nitrilase